MADWTESMNQTFEYYLVDPGTWEDVRKLDNILSSTIDTDITTDTIDSASINVSDILGECYIRIYLITNQNGITEKHSLGTFLVQSPAYSFNGLRKEMSLDAYSPLVELKEKQPPIGYSILKGANIMENAFRLVRENVRAPVIMPECDKTLQDDFVANLDENWCSFVIDLITNAKYELGLDEKGRIMFKATQKTEAMRPRYTFTDDNSSILLPDISVNRDLYGIPNVVEVVYTANRHNYSARVENKNPNSPISIPSRGREIVQRVVNPNMGGMPSQYQVESYAKRTLEELSSLEYTVKFKHGYCGVRAGDCVLLNYERAGITNVKAKIIGQSITCKTGCSVSSTAVFTNNLWR